MCMYSNYDLTREQIAQMKEEVYSYGKIKRKAFESIRSMSSELPDYVLDWARESMPKTMFYIKLKRGSYDAYCEACGMKVHLTRARSSRIIECPACGATVQLHDGAKSPNGAGYYMACAYLDRDGGDFTQRLFECYKRCWRGGEEVDVQYYFSEEERDFLHEGTEFAFHPISQGKNAGKWILGFGRVHGQGWSGWRLRDREINTYPYNLRAVLSGTKYQYSALEIAAEHNLVNPFYYFNAYNDEPKLEILYKVGLYRAAEEITEFSADDARRMMRNVRSLKDLGIESRAEAAECSALTVEELIARKEVKAWKIEEQDRAAAIEFIRKVNARSGTDFYYDFISRKRWFQYYLTQKSVYTEVKDFNADYTDYISMCSRCGANLNDTAVKMPHSMKKAHDWAMIEEKVQGKQAYNELVAAVYDSIHTFTEWNDGKLQVIMPRTAREIVEEGVRQNHCVGRYVERVAAGESVILFIRRIDDPEKNFYTMEIKKDMRRCNIVQVRGEKNAAATDEVNAFCAKYKKWFNKRKLNGYNGDTVTVRYYKAVHKKKDGRYISGWDGRTVYRIGDWIETDTDTNPDNVAVKGIHIASLDFAVNYGGCWNDAAILEVEANIHDIVVPDAKDQVRARKIRVLREVPRQEWKKENPPMEQIAG